MNSCLNLSFLGLRSVLFVFFVFFKSSLFVIHSFIENIVLLLTLRQTTNQNQEEVVTTLLT